MPQHTYTHIYIIIYFIPDNIFDRLEKREQVSSFSDILY